MLAAALRGAPNGRRPRIVLRSAWQTINIGDVGHTPGVLRLITATVLALAQDPAAARAKAGKARAYVRQCQRETMAILKRNLVGRAISP